MWLCTQVIRQLGFHATISLCSCFDLQLWCALRNLLIWQPCCSAAGWPCTQAIMQLCYHATISLHIHTTLQSCCLLGNLSIRQPFPYMPSLQHGHGTMHPCYYTAILCVAILLHRFILWFTFYIWSPSSTTIQLPKTVILPGNHATMHLCYHAANLLGNPLPSHFIMQPYDLAVKINSQPCY